MLQPNLDIVIPAYNHPDLLIACVESLRGQKRLGTIHVIDDCSDKDNAAIFENIDGIEIGRNDKNEGFIKSVRRGAKYSTSPYVLILNSDTEAHPYAIERMAEALDEGYAVVGAKLVFPKLSHWPDAIQHAGIGFNVWGIPYHPFMYMSSGHPCVNIRREVNAVTGAAMAVRREWWDRVGGFDKKYEPGVFEDVDYCLMVKRAGGLILYEPRAIFTHRQHGSQPDGGGWFTEPHINERLGILVTKHGVQTCDDDIFYNMRRPLFKAEEKPNVSKPIIRKVG